MWSFIKIRAAPFICVEYHCYLAHYFLMKKTTVALLKQLPNANYRALARAISLIENEVGDYQNLLQQLVFNKATPVIGITGPPGAGKSTLLNSVLKYYLQNNQRIAIIAIDPTSPFNYGALLGDRIRLTQYYNHPNVFIRSLATRGSLGGLCHKIIEVLEVVKAANFDAIFVETVGVGQSEVEIAALADTTVVTLVPEAGDDIQTMKAGVMEIADIFVVNKADRADASRFARNLRQLVHARPKQLWQVPVLKTIATQENGIVELVEKIQQHSQIIQQNTTKKAHLFTQKALQIIQQQRMKDINQQQLFQQINTQLQKTATTFNLYAFLSNAEIIS